MFHAVSDNAISRTLVLPRTVARDRQWISVLKRLGIELIEYEIDSDSMRFVGARS